MPRLTYRLSSTVISHSPLHEGSRTSFRNLKNERTNYAKDHTGDDLGDSGARFDRNLGRRLGRAYQIFIPASQDQRVFGKPQHWRVCAQGRQLTGWGGCGNNRVTASTNTFPDIGASSVTIYYRDGVSKQLISWKQLAPNSSGISKFTGHGKCAGGTGIHKKEKCNYTFTGTYNGKTTWNDIRLTGTDTR